MNSILLIRVGPIRLCLSTHPLPLAEQARVRWTLWNALRVLHPANGLGETHSGCPMPALGKSEAVASLHQYGHSRDLNRRVLHPSR